MERSNIESVCNPKENQIVCAREIINCVYYFRYTYYYNRVKRRKIFVLIFLFLFSKKFSKTLKSQNEENSLCVSNQTTN